MMNARLVSRLSLAIQLIVLLLMLIASEAQQQEAGGRGHVRRRLINDTTKCWKQCVAQRMTASECQALIEAELGGHSLQYHAIPHLKISVRHKRSNRAFHKSYWFVGIPTDLNGNVACDANNGIVRYPWFWDIPYNSTDFIGVPLPEVNCLGQSAIECCSRFKATMVKKDIPLTDVHGRRMSCYVYQQPLEPRIIDSELIYIDDQWNDEIDICQPVEKTLEKVQSLDAITAANLGANVATIDRLLVRHHQNNKHNKASCVSFLKLRNELMMNARGLRRAMRLIGDMLTNVCDESGQGNVNVNPIRGHFRTVLYKIRNIIAVARHNLRSDENLIVIYTDEHNHVIEPPKIGGSTEHIDWNLNDECSEDALMCQPNDPPGEPFVEGAEFNPANPDYACVGSPIGNLATDTEMLDHSINLIHYDPNVISASGLKSTQFVYEVCSSQINPIYHVTLSWTGHCRLVEYAYIGMDGNEIKLHQDPLTCLVGLRFNQNWDMVVANGPACAQLMLTVDGRVAKAPTEAAIYIAYDAQGQGNTYKLIDVEGPDCSECPLRSSKSMCESNRVASPLLCPDCAINLATRYSKSACVPQATWLDLDGYSIMLNRVESAISNDNINQRLTKFVYKVCQAGQQLQQLKNIITAVTLSWDGTCKITQIEPSSSFTNFIIGQDPQTCLPGIAIAVDKNYFTNQDEPTCKEVTLVLDGVVSSTSVVEAALLLSDNTFERFRVEGPDCSACS